MSKILPVFLYHSIAFSKSGTAILKIPFIFNFLFHIFKTFPLEKASDAHVLMESGAHMGKIILTVG